MQFYILILIFCFLIFLFCLHFLSRDDFIFLRKNITLDRIFNVAFLLSLVGILSARLVFVLLHFSHVYLNPLVFFIFPYFPGLSLAGGIIGGWLFLFYFSMVKKLPFKKLFDLFSLSFLSAVPIGSIGLFVLSRKTFAPVFPVIALLYFLLFLFFIVYFLPRTVSGRLKDGNFGLALFACTTFISLLANLLSTTDGLSHGLFANKENALYLLLFIFCIAILIKDNLLGKK